MSQPLWEPSPHYTERDMLDLLHDRYSAISQGLPRYVIAEHVRSACGLGWGADRIRVADFIAQDTIPSAGLRLHGHEVKVSRSDWLTELADPSKAEAIKRYCDRWWLVVPDESIVKDDLPDRWGLLVIGGDGRLRARHRAPALTPEPMPATFRAALMRAVAKTANRGATR